MGFKAEPKEYSMESLLASEDIDESWVAGNNNDPPFDKLTIQERQLIKWRYIDGKRSSEISLKINEHPNTVREHLKNARLKLEEIILDDPEMAGLIKDLNLKRKNNELF